MKYINRNPIIYVLSGKAKSGKNTLANIIEKHYQDKKCIQLSFAHYLKEYVKNITDWNGEEESKPRDLLQSMGIDLLKKINNNLLIDRLCDDIRVYSYFFDVIIVTDARLIEEVETLKNNFDCVTIRVISNLDNGLTEEQKNHITETNLDNYSKFDFIIKNNDLEKQILEVIK